MSNIAHKLAAGLTGCVSAAAKKQDCKAGAVGSIIGEMVGDWLVTEKLKQSIESGEIKLGSDEYNKLLNTAQVDVNDLGELKITGDLWKTLPDDRQTIIVRPTTYMLILIKIK